MDTTTPSVYGTTQPGIGHMQIPEMPAYVQAYTKRGGEFPGNATPVYNRTRFGNPRYIGGMSGYINHVEDSTFFTDLRLKKGNQGVFEGTRWAPQVDTHNGMQGISATKNWPGLMTRGGEMRRGAGKRGDYFNTPNYYQKLRPGMAVSRMPQNENFSGIREDQRLTPVVTKDVDTLQLQQLETNPFHIESHAYANAKRDWAAQGVYPTLVNTRSVGGGYKSGLPDTRFNAVFREPEQSFVS